jgi:hypothetical protein
MIGNVVAARPTLWRLGSSSVDSLITKAPSIAASTGTSIAVSTGAIAAGSALSIALPVIGIVLGAVLGSLFAAHEARVKGATTENEVLNSLIPTVTSALQSIFSSLNSGDATPAQAIAALQALQQQYWQEVAGVETGAGQGGGPQKCTTKSGAGLHITGTASVQDPPGSSYSGYGPVSMDSSCTASCAVGCMWIASWCNVGAALINAGGGTVTFDGVVGNKYGLTNYPDVTISYTPPAASSAAAAGSEGGAIDTLVTAGVSSSFLGVPLWMLIAGGLLAWKVL